VRCDCKGSLVAAAKDHTLGTVTIFTDAQAAIWRVTSDDPGPGQKYAIMVRKHTAALHAKEPGVCPSHQDIEGNEIADEWAKQAADEPDARGVEWLDFKFPHGIVRKRRFPLPRSLAKFKCDFSKEIYQSNRKTKETEATQPEYKGLCEEKKEEEPVLGIPNA